VTKMKVQSNGLARRKCKEHRDALGRARKNAKGNKNGRRVSKLSETNGLPYHCRRVGKNQTCIYRIHASKGS